MESTISYIAGSSGELLLVFVAVYMAAYLFYQRQTANDDSRRLPPAMMSLPVVGSLPFLPSKMEDLAEFCISPTNKLGKIFTFRAGSKNVLVICGRKAFHEALVTKSVDFAGRPEFYGESLVNKKANGIIFARYDSSFKIHRQQCVSILKRFGFGQRVMETRILMEVEEMISTVRAEQGRPFNFKHLTTSCVSNVIMNILFGRRFDLEDEKFQQLISDYDELTAAFTIALDLFPVLRHLPYFKSLMSKSLKTAERCFDFLNTNIASCIKDGNKTESFVGCLVEAGGADYDQEQILFTVRDLLSAGMETTATSVLWAIVLLTNHAAVQERLHAEIDSVVGRKRLPTLDDRSRLPYVEATILELMRYKTLAPLALPHYTLKDTELSGYFIPKGTMVITNLHSVHMDPDEWQQPQQFRPERFLDASGNVIDRDRIIPFSLGKRSCLGEQLARQEIFLFVVSLLQNFHFKPPEGQESIDVREVWGATNAPTSYEVRMVARDS